MAETTTAMGRSKVWLKAQDNAASKTYTFANVVPGSLKRGLNLERGKDIAYAQTQGADIIHAVSDQGIKGPSTLTFTMYIQDMANSDTANGNALDTVRQSYKNTFSNYWSGATSTNPLPGGNCRMLDWILTYVGLGSAAANVTATAAGYVAAMSEEKEVNGHLAVDVTVTIVEVWVEA